MLIWVIAKPETMPFLGKEGALYGMVDFPQYTITFILGALVYVNVEEIHLHWKHAVLMAVIMFVFKHSSIGTWVWATGYIVIAMIVGTNQKFFALKVKDLSYGIFLYGWPIGQLVYELIPTASALVAAIVTAILATVVAFASEKLINIIEENIQCFIKKNKIRRENI